MFLENHNRRYNLSLNDALLSLATGLSGAPYAKRHWQLSKNCDPKHVYVHRTLACLEAIPVLGGLAALIERIAFFIKEIFSKKQKMPAQPQSPNVLSLRDRVDPLKVESKEPLEVKYPTTQIAQSSSLKASATAGNLAARKMWQKAYKMLNNARKMQKNAHKAIEEHSKSSKAYATSVEALPSVQTMMHHKPLSPLVFRFFSGAERGPRQSMEDRHFFQEIEQGVITGVFDGHGGHQVAEFANEQAKKQFSSIFAQTSGNIHQTFTLLINQIHDEVAQNKSWEHAGTTAVICFVDKHTHKIYTATLGDSEANVYRKIGENLQSIPLSCIRNWSSKKDAKRASIALEAPEIATSWPSHPDPKRLRFMGINVSRAIGDLDSVGTPEKPGVIHKPKITMSQLQPGDTLILASDGLKDYVSEHEILNCLRHPSKDSAKTLADYAIHEHGKDNVTVCVISIDTN